MILRKQDSGIGEKEIDKKLHYGLTKEYFRKSAANKKGYYENKSIEEIRRDLLKRKMWKIYIASLNKILQNNSGIISVLDAGCGMGNFTLELVNNNQFKKIVGIDFLKETFFLARENKEQFRKVSFVQGDLLNTPFKERSFDVTVCLNVLHHIHKEDFNKIMYELRRITGKYLIIEIRNKKNIFNFFYEKILLPLYNKDLPLYCHSIKQASNSDKHNFELERIKGNFSRNWGCRRLVLAYRRIH